MTAAPKPIRIAIVLKDQGFRCRPVSLPFSLEGYPPVDVVLYGTPVNPLTGLHPEQFDLILDAQVLTAGLSDISLDKRDNLINGSVVNFLRGLVCQLQELRQKQEINSGIINNATDAIITINEDHVIVGFNHEAEQMFGYARAEALGQDLTIVIPPPYKAEHRDYVRRYVATREARMIGKHVRLTGQRRNGQAFPLSISFSVVEIHGSLYFTAIMRDITEYKAMEDRVLQTEVLAAVGNTVAHIAHEIKNPLLIIGGFARQLLRVPEFDVAAHYKLSTIVEEVMHLEEMVAAMLYFVRRPPAEKRQGDIDVALVKALNQFQDSFKDHNIQVRQVAETRLPIVAFDPKQLHQVLINLFQNAQEAMSGGGEITIASRVRGPHVEISITDTGAGMPSEVTSSIFQPYFTTKEKGTGLGLAICQSIMQEHGGYIFVDSTLGRGSTFTIQLPLQEAAPSARKDLPPGASQPEDTQNKMTTAPESIRIAIVINGQEFLCHPISLPFSLEGYPPVDVVLYSTEPEVLAGIPVNPLTGLHPEQFDLILDAQFLTAGLSDFSPDKRDNLVNGPVVNFLKGVVCQLQELRQKQEINSGIINSATDAIITINEDHVIVGFNHGAEQMFGYTREEALGQDLTIVIPPPYRAEHRAYVRRYVATREARMIGKHVRLTALRRDGREFPMSISFSVAEIRDNLYFTGIIRDITEYQEMEERVIQSERLAAVGNTVTHIAHEIKNPLLIIGGFARQLLKTPNLDDKANRKLSMIAEEVTHLEEMVAEMRDFVHRPPAQRQTSQIVDALRETLELFQDTFAEHQITVRQVAETPLPPLSFDPRQMRQVFLNLLKNALEAMPRGGEITITTRVREPYAEIRIADTGEGMSSEVAGNIFQPYFTTKEKGTGLGLAICQSIIHEHGGAISVDSAPGRGTTFIIQLPLDEVQPT